MIVRLIKKSKMYNFSLPTKVAGNYWLTDDDRSGNNRNLINIEAEDGKWKIKSDFETKVMSGNQEIDSAYLTENSLYFLKINTDNEFVILYCSPSIEKKENKIQIIRSGEILIGNDFNAHINYNHTLVSKQHAKFIYNNGSWVIQDLNSKYGTYVNNVAVTTKTLEYGDIVFIMGLKIVVMKDFIVVNSIGDNIRYDSNTFSIMNPIVQKQTAADVVEDEGIDFYNENDYFFRSPRFKSKIEPVDIVVEDPPA